MLELFGPHGLKLYFTRLTKTVKNLHSGFLVHYGLMMLVCVIAFIAGLLLNPIISLSLGLIVALVLPLGLEIKTSQLRKQQNYSIPGTLNNIINHNIMKKLTCISAILPFNDLGVSLLTAFLILGWAIYFVIIVFLVKSVIFNIVNQTKNKIANNLLILNQIINLYFLLIKVELTYYKRIKNKAGRFCFILGQITYYFILASLVLVFVKAASDIIFFCFYITLRISFVHGVYSLLIVIPFLLGTSNFFLNKQSFFFTPLFFFLVFVFITSFCFRFNFSLFYIDYPTFIEQVNSKNNEDNTSSTYYNSFSELFEGFFEKTNDPSKALRKADFHNALTPFEHDVFTKEDFFKEEEVINTGQITSTIPEQETIAIPRRRKLAFYGLAPLWEGTYSYASYAASNYTIFPEDKDLFTLFKRPDPFVELYYGRMNLSEVFPLTSNFNGYKADCIVLKESSLPIFEQQARRRNIILTMLTRNWCSCARNYDLVFFMEWWQRANPNFNLEDRAQVMEALETFTSVILTPLEVFENSDRFLDPVDPERHVALMQHMYNMTAEKIAKNGQHAHNSMFNWAVSPNKSLYILGETGLYKKQLVLQRLPGDTLLDLQAKQAQRADWLASSIYQLAREDTELLHSTYLIGEHVIRFEMPLSEEQRVELLSDPSQIVSIGSIRISQIFLHYIEEREKQIQELTG